MAARSTAAAEGGEGSAAPTVEPATGAAEADTTVEGGAESVPPKARKGWVKHTASGTFHEVDDLDAANAAYPGQFEVVAKKDVDDKKVGWPKEPAKAD